MNMNGATELEPAAGKPLVEQPRPGQTRQIDDQRQKDLQPYLEYCQPNGEVVSAVISGFLLEHLDAYLDWIKGLNPNERGSCLGWITKEQEKTRSAQRRLAWVASKGDTAMLAEKRLRVELDALREEQILRLRAATGGPVRKRLAFQDPYELLKDL